MHMSNLLANRFKWLYKNNSIHFDCNSVDFRWIFRPDGTTCMSLQLPWPTVYDFIPGCSHSWRTVLCNHQHNESITTAPSSLRKVSVEENQSIQRLRWWLSYVHWTFALNFHESCRLFWLISGKVCIVLFSVKAYDATCFHDLVTFWLTTFMTCKSKSSLFL